MGHNLYIVSVVWLVCAACPRSSRICQFGLQGFVHVYYLYQSMTALIAAGYRTVLISLRSGHAGSLRVVSVSL